MKDWILHRICNLVSVDNSEVKSSLSDRIDRSLWVATLQKRCKIHAWCINQHKLDARRAGVATLFARNQI